jgi:hypothetical protein
MAKDVVRTNPVSQARREYQSSLSRRWERERQNEAAEVIAGIMMREQIQSVEIDGDGKMSWKPFGADEDQEDE